MKSKVNLKRCLCLIGRHKPVLITALPEKLIVSGFFSSITLDHPGGEMQVKGKVVCLWCGKPLKGIMVVISEGMEGGK